MDVVDEIGIAVGGRVGISVGKETGSPSSEKSAMRFARSLSPSHGENVTSEKPR